jgi:hydroxymethylbilane synthase
MTDNINALVIATRASRLALWQAEHVRDRLQALYPDCQVSLLTMTTRGDQILDRSLSKVGGKGLFVKELETALQDGRADLAVHSLKDVPVDMQSEFELSTILERDDPRDAFVSNDYASLDALPRGAVVGTSSLRRESQIRHRYPHLFVQPLRGNLDTRLGKLDRGEYAAIILAAVGLKRLGLGTRIRSYLPVEQSLPAAGQGALGIEILASRADLRAKLAPLACASTTACALAERAVSRALGGSCQVPLAAYAYQDGDSLQVDGLVAKPDGSRILLASITGPLSDAEQLGQRLAQQLLEQGASAILSSINGGSHERDDSSYAPTGQK